MKEAPRNAAWRTTLVAILLVVSAYAMRCVVLPRLLPPTRVEYLGHEIVMAKWYYDYDDLKYDSQNLGPESQALVERLLTSASMGRTFAERKAMVRAVSELRFPGYCLTQFAQTTQADGSVLTGY